MTEYICNLQTQAFSITELRSFPLSGLHLGDHYIEFRLPVASVSFSKTILGAFPPECHQTLLSFFILFALWRQELFFQNTSYKIDDINLAFTVSVIMRYN